MKFFCFKKAIEIIEKLGGKVSLTKNNMATVADRLANNLNFEKWKATELRQDYFLL